ncbi:MAG: ATP-grasp domain-containing protein, partial [Rhizobiaceae bacterium]|nr:ATP-grasp domain-containing protein [Rhizobiaceae bacterium]
GYHGANQDAGFLAREAEKIGYPVLIKARAGGGGKGMRQVEKPKEFAAALEGAVREGQASFGDGHVLIEKFISSPRHIEIQVFGDSHGNVVHLFERDCSMQRRHQKVIEEAPAPGMTQEMRAAMGEAAVNAAKAVNYCGAGTVEFIVDGSDGLQSDRFWFMEMNTRLQVEHPVTEMITGLDLVELQLRVANGETLPFAQHDLSIEGWAFEARIYAEDPANGFLPSVGELHRYDMPTHLARVDDGVEVLDEISPHYDPMIGKIITYGSDRQEALGKMKEALRETFVVGVTTNVAFLLALCSSKSFCGARIDTGLIEREMVSLLDDGKADKIDVAIAALTEITGPWNGFEIAFEGRMESWTHWGAGKSWVDLVYDGQPYSAWVRYLGGSNYGVDIGTGEIQLNFDMVTETEASLDSTLISWADGSRKIRSDKIDENLIITGDGKTHVFHVVDPLGGKVADDENSDLIHAPMPGLIKIVQVKKGDSVEQGEVLMVVEAMKMEHSLVAPREGVVENIHGVEGGQIEDGALLISLVKDQAV